MPARLGLVIALFAATTGAAQTFKCPASVRPAAKWPNQIEENGVRLTRLPEGDEESVAMLSLISTSKDSIYCSFAGPAGAGAVYLLPRKAPASVACADAHIAIAWPDHIGESGGFALDREGAKEKRALFTGTRAESSDETCRYKAAEPLKGATYRFALPHADKRCARDSNQQVTCH